MTNNLHARLLEHQSKITSSFTARYNINRLVRVEHFLYVSNAIRREKELKDWTVPRRSR